MRLALWPMPRPTNIAPTWPSRWRSPSDSCSSWCTTNAASRSDSSKDRSAVTTSMARKPRPSDSSRVSMSHPAWRRKGVARQLYDAIGDWARARGCRELASDALLDNEVSQRAHRALGFRETERVVYFTKRALAAPTSGLDRYLIVTCRRPILRRNGNDRGRRLGRSRNRFLPCTAVGCRPTWCAVASRGGFDWWHCWACCTRAALWGGVTLHRSRAFDVGGSYLWLYAALWLQRGRHGLGTGTC